MLRLVLLLIPLVACASPADDVPPPHDPDPRCASPTGTQHEQTFVDGGESRVYLLHVPASYTCAAPAAVLVDLHGAYGADRPEEAYSLEAAIAESERAGFILLRPRSRSSMSNGVTWYRWDENPGDVQRNQELIAGLLSELAQRYAIDDTRVYAIGYSSGANMAAQLIDDPSFAGIALVGGAAWSPLALPALDATSPRVYFSTGARDYHRAFAEATEAQLRAAGLPDERILVRDQDTGHALRPWHFTEAIAFFERGERPARMTSPAWTIRPAPTEASLLEVATTATGPIAGDSAGRLWSLGTTPALVFEAPAVPGRSPAIGGLCVRGGAGVLSAGPTGAVLGPQGWTTVRPGVSPSFGISAFLTADCTTDGELHLAGWGGTRSADGGATWSPLDDGPGEILGVRRSPTGTTIAAGQTYVARATAGTGWSYVVAADAFDVFYNAVALPAPGVAIVAGVDGQVLRSTDDGRTFTPAVTPGHADLYAVTFRDASRGAIGGHAGTVWWTADGGATWQDISLGGDQMIAGVTFLDDQHLLVVGERGLVAERTVP